MPCVTDAGVCDFILQASDFGYHLPMPLHRYKMTIAYDGTAYCGWQRQPDPTPTVQRTVERAAGEIVDHPVTCHGSSRTDQGVHAWGQVAYLETTSDLEPDRLRYAINSRLPGDVLIRLLEPVTNVFDVRAARCKRYRYCIWTGRDRPLFQRQYVYHFPGRLDLPRLQAACRLLEGTHDFASMQGKSEPRLTTERTIFHCVAHQRGELIVVGVEGDGFLYHMVRNMVGTALEAARGKLEPERIGEILQSRDRAKAGPCLPAQGLCLQWIRF